MPHFFLEALTLPTKSTDALLKKKKKSIINQVWLNICHKSLNREIPTTKEDYS